MSKTVTTLSTADLARMFEVTETTIKRWADAGELQCEKTPGGHRKFRLASVLEFADSRGFTPSIVPGVLEKTGIDRETESAIIDKDLDRLKEAFLQKVRSTNTGELTSFLLALSRSNISIVKLCDEIIDPAMDAVGNLWLAGKLGIDTEHKASYEVLNALSRIEEKQESARPTGRTAVLACPENELHEIGLRGLAGILRLQGWNVVYLGANMPTESIIDSIRTYSPEVVCLSLSNPAMGVKLQAELRTIYESTRQANGTLVLGGTGFNKRFVDAQICDYVCESTREFLALSHRLP